MSAARMRPARRTAMLAQPPSRRLVWATALLAGAGATLVRVWFSGAWNEADTIDSVFYRGDAPAFVRYAATLAAGGTFDNGVPFHPAGWPAVLALYLKLFSPSHAASLKLFVACVSGAAVAATTLAAAELAGTGAMLAAALLGTFHFGHIVEGTVPGSEPLYGGLVAIWLLLGWRWMDRGHTTGNATATRGGVMLALAAGALGAFTTLVRAEFAIGLAGLALLRARWGRGGRARAIELAAYALAVAATLTPTTVWHWRSLTAFNAAHRDRLAGPLPRFAPITSYGAFNFATANHAEADGGPNNDHPALAACGPSRDSAGMLDLACPGVYDLYVHGYRIGAAWMVGHPLAAASLAARRAAMASGAFALGYFFDDVGAGVDGERRRVDLFDPRSRTLWLVHVALILGGAIALRRKRAALALLSVPVAALAASTLLFFGYVRLAVAYMPVFWILQGAAAAALGSWLFSGAGRRAPYVLCLVGLLLLAIVGATRGTRRAVALAGTVDAAGQILQDDAVEIHGVR